MRKITGIVEVCAQAPAHLEAVDVGEPDVEHDEPRPVLGDRPDAVFAGGRLHDPEAVAAEVELDQVGDVRLVVDDEDRARAPYGSHRRIPTADHM